MPGKYPTLRRIEKIVRGTSDFGSLTWSVNVYGLRHPKTIRVEPSPQPAPLQLRRDHNP